MSWSTTGKCCLTCAYWCGERVDKFGKWEAPSNTTCGQCRCGHKINPSAPSSSDCPKYVNIPPRK